MNKNSKIIIGVVIVLVIVVAGFALMHKSNKNDASTAVDTPSQNQGGTPVVNNAVLITKSDPTVGKYLADPSGKPLYTYNADKSGVSNCTGDCLTEWQAYQA